MTRLEFIELCQSHLIDPSLALENEHVIDALQSRDDDQVKQVLTTEF